MTDLTTRLSRMRPLPPDAFERLRGIAAAEDIRFTWASNALEGNTLTLRETQRVIEEGVTIPGKSLREHLEAVNHAAAVRRIHEIVAAQSLLSANVMLDVHAIVMRGIDDAWAGRIRNGDVSISGTTFRPPNAFAASDGVDELFRWYADAKERNNPALVAADLHYDLVRLHPFYDGNGRTARLLMNAHLIAQSYAPLVIEPSRRGAYLEALDQGQELGDRRAFREFIVEGVALALDDYRRRLAPTDRERYNGP